MIEKQKITISYTLIRTGYPVSVSGMITLPVSSSMYQSMVANIQQIHTNGDGTLCITPMQVQKTGHQNPIGHSANNSSISSTCNGNNNKNISSNSSVNSSFSCVGSISTSMLANCPQNNQFAHSNAVQSILNAENRPINDNNNGLQELCRVFNQATHNNQINSANGIAFNNTQPNLVNVNDKKLTKCKKSPNSIQQFNASNYATNPMITYNVSQQIANNVPNMGQRNYGQQQHMAIDRGHDHSDSNNNLNANGDHSNQESSASAESKSLKSNIFQTSTDTVHMIDGEIKTIKMECELDAT